MPNDEPRTPNSNSQLYYEIAQSASDPNRPWQLVEKDASGEEYSRTGFRTYGDAWHAAERRKSDEIGCQATLLIRAAQQQAFRPSEYKADILTWSERQASLLRRIAAGEKIIDQIDWENVIEEVDSAGRRQLTEVRSLLVQALASMLKAWAWPGRPEIPRWQTEARGFQREATDLLTPSMLRRININDFYFKAIRLLPKLIDDEQPLLFPTECPFTLDDLLGN
jgi:Domain of unknown function DUF29